MMSRAFLRPRFSALFALALFATGFAIGADRLVLAPLVLLSACAAWVALQVYVQSSEFDGRHS